MHPTRALAPALAPGALFRRWLALAASLMFLSACAELPEQVERPVSKSLATPEGTALGALTQTLRRSSSAGDAASGFLLVGGAQEAYSARLALIEGAQKTLDLQYYAIHGDASAARLLSAIHATAGRGVRVRILLDDYHSSGRNALAMRLAFEPNIEMRMFNPLAGARGSFVRRMFNALDDAEQLQQRMHNKLFIADNAMGLTGGRNLGDAYFGAGDKINFVDLDVLAAGPIVKDLSRSFDDYWNNDRAYPVQSLVTRAELDRIRERARRAQEDSDKAAQAQPNPPDGAPMDLRKARFVWAPAVVLVDKPGKIPLNPEGKRSGESAPRQPGLVVRGGQRGALPAAAAEDDSVVDGLLSLFGRARSELNIVSPYFVPGTDMKQALAAALSRGVRVRVLTNSLASNDAQAAHAGYARHREELLAMGIELYEMRIDPAAAASLGSSGGELGGSSRSMLHSKLLTLDGRLIVVGTMNLDLRSQLQNTEIALLIRSEELALTANQRIEEAFRTGTWRVEMVDGRLLWRAPQGSGLPDSSTEPDASLGLRLMIRLLGPLAPDRLL
ncbi:phosphatidylserine/phosphatidylglycerophosphate/cardiolipin synthase family protein [Variovorax sp. LARHSF232]